MPLEKRKAGLALVADAEAGEGPAVAARALLGVGQRPCAGRRGRCMCDAAARRRAACAGSACRSARCCRSGCPGRGTCWCCPGVEERLLEAEQVQGHDAPLPTRSSISTAPALRVETPRTLTSSRALQPHDLPLVVLVVVLSLSVAPETLPNQPMTSPTAKPSVTSLSRQMRRPGMSPSGTTDLSIGDAQEMGVLRPDTRPPSRPVAAILRAPRHSPASPGCAGGSPSSPRTHTCAARAGSGRWRVKSSAVTRLG